MAQERKQEKQERPEKGADKAEKPETEAAAAEAKPRRRREKRVVPRGARPELTLIGTRPGLPGVAAGLVQARPALARAQYGPDSTITIGRFQVP